MKKALLAATAVALVAAGYVLAQTAIPRTSSSQSAPQAPTAEGASQSTTRPDRDTPSVSDADQGTQLRLARMNTSMGAFRKLDKDNDGRISPLEAADNPKVAAAFSMADKDKDGYLSKEEFQALGTAHPQSADVGASSPSGDKVTEPSGDQPATSPQTPPPEQSADSDPNAR